MSDKQIVNSPKSPPAIGPYSQAVITGNLIFTAGQIPIDPETGKIVEGNFKTHVRQVLRNIDNILESADSSLKNAVKLTVFLTDLSKFQELNEVFSEEFKEDPPARATVQVSRLPKDVAIEMDCIAVKRHP